MGWQIKETMDEGLGKSGFGERALCSNVRQEKRHSKDPR